MKPKMWPIQYPQTVWPEPVMIFLRPKECHILHNLEKTCLRSDLSSCVPLDLPQTILYVNSTKPLMHNSMIDKKNPIFLVQKRIHSIHQLCHRSSSLFGYFLQWDCFTFSIHRTILFVSVQLTTNFIALLLIVSIAHIPHYVHYIFWSSSHISNYLHDTQSHTHNIPDPIAHKARGIRNEQWYGSPPLLVLCITSSHCY